MARYIGPDCRLCRREREKLFLKGEKCLTNRCVMVKRGSPPGQAVILRATITEYGLRLRAKQRLKRIYGLFESQFRRFFDLTGRQRAIPRGEKLIELLERRLDNVLYRLGFAPSRDSARQLVTHGHIVINDSKVYAPSYITRVGDVLKLSADIVRTPQIQQHLESIKSRSIPPWLELLPDGLSGRVVELPKRSMVDIPVDERLVVEFYSR